MKWGLWKMQISPKRVVQQYLARKASSIPSIIKWHDELVVDDYPYGRFTTQARFFVEKGSKGQRAGRITVDPKTGRPNKPKYTVYVPSVKIGEGSDGRTYILSGSPGQIRFTASDMMHDVGSGIYTKDPEYAALAKVLGFQAKPSNVQVHSTPKGAVIDGLQGTTKTVREILTLGGLDADEVKSAQRKSKFSYEEWTVTFKDGRPNYIIQVKS